MRVAKTIVSQKKSRYLTADITNVQYSVRPFNRMNI